MNRRTSRARLGLTYVDLLAVISICVLCLGAMQLGIFGARERANRVKCASNLRQIGQGLMLYANDNKMYPRTTYDPKETKLNFYTAPNATDPFAKDGPAVNDVTAAMFLLVRLTDLSPEVFRCPTAELDQRLAEMRAYSDPATRPSKPAWPEKGLLEYANFPAPEYLAYGITNPYPSEKAVKVGYKWSPNVSADWAIAGDRGPAGDDKVKVAPDAPPAEMKKANSPNHRGDGGNLLFNDGHVEWTTSPFAGANRDNVYTRAATTPAEEGPKQKNPPASEPGADPALDLDSILVPTADQKPTGKKE